MFHQHGFANSNRPNLPSPRKVKYREDQIQIFSSIFTMTNIERVCCERKTQWNEDQQNSSWPTETEKV
jgi:hypothetical protein